MTDPIVLLSAACLVLCVIVAVLAASVPALWLLHVRATMRCDAMTKELAEARADLRVMDDVVDRLCKAANLNKE